MNNKKHLVAFIDILGFKSLIENHFNGKDKNSLAILKNAMKDAEEFAIGYSKQYLKQFNIKFTFRQFSDCISISMPLKQKQSYSVIAIYGAFINVIRLYQYILLDNNILVRGAISIGGHFENSSIIFSEALVKSYKLESQNAIYPRILLDKDLLVFIENYLKDNPKSFEEFYQFYGNSIIKDWDDEIFISPFGLISELKAIENNFGEDKLKEIIQIFSDANKLEEEFKNNWFDDLKKRDIDREIIDEILALVNNNILQNSSSKHEVIIKHKWLKEFILWNISPGKSKIKFARYFK